MGILKFLDLKNILCVVYDSRTRNNRLIRKCCISSATARIIAFEVIDPN